MLSLHAWIQGASRRWSSSTRFVLEYELSGFEDGWEGEVRGWFGRRKDRKVSLDVREKVREPTYPLRRVLRVPNQLLRVGRGRLAPQLPELIHGDERLAEPVQGVDQRDDFCALQEVRVRVGAAMSASMSMSMSVSGSRRRGRGRGRGRRM